VGLVRVDPGFDPSHLLVAEVQLPGARYPRDAQRIEYIRRVRESLATLAGVTATAAGSGIPLSPGSLNVVARPGPEGRPGAVLVFIAAVSPDYFRVLGIPLLRGRTLEAVDPDAVVVDAALAQEFFPGQDPVGKRFTFYGNVTRTVVGVVGNVRQEMLPIPAPMHLYRPYASEASSFLKILLVTRGDPARSAAAVRWSLQQVDPDVPVDRVEPMTGLMAASLAKQRLYALLLGSFGVMALVLSAVGVYGLVSYGVSHRTREFGIRIALGAAQGSVLRLVVGRALLLGGLGSLLGLAGALAVTRTLRGLLYGVRPSDPWALAGAGLLLFAVTMAASYLPARRATRVDPVVALRSQ
jgi:putative ABC transport system permease protein